MGTQASYGSFFSGKPIISWAIDQFDIVEKAYNANFKSWDKKSLSEYVKEYDKDVYKEEVMPVFTQSPFPLNLGGATTKQRIVATDNPNGVFNFSLASNYLYPLQEYYSEQLAKDQPDKFAEDGLLPGVVPANMVEKIGVGDSAVYVYIDTENNKEYVLEKRIKGQTAIDNGVPLARLKYASRAKKVYQTYKRAGGKVRYVEIYSLFYYTSLVGDFQYAVRHIPALMVAGYLESVGIKTRVYMTRFVVMTQGLTLKDKTDSGQVLPMAKNASVKTTRSQLVVQPIIAKDFMQEPDPAFAFCISSSNFTRIYESCLKYTYKQETENGSDIYGDPDFSNEEYWEGFDRYRNKYLEYVKEGIFKSKEVTADSMILFHDMSIKKHFATFIANCKTYYEYIEDHLLVLKPVINVFFAWWMRLSATTIKHKVTLVNSTSYSKDAQLIYSEIRGFYDEFKSIVANAKKIDKTPNGYIGQEFAVEVFEKYGQRILAEYSIISSTSANHKFTPLRYIDFLIKEMLHFALGDVYETDMKTAIEMIEKIDEIKTEVNKL